jgi:hypothetical protein
MQTRPSSIGILPVPGEPPGGILGDSEEYDPDGQQADEAPDGDRFPSLS